MRCRDSTPRTGESNQEVVDGASGAEDKDGPLIDDRTILWQTEFRTPGSAGNRRSGRRHLLRPVLAQAAGAEPNAKRAAGRGASVARAGARSDARDPGRGGSARDGGAGADADHPRGARPGAYRPGYTGLCPACQSDGGTSARLGRGGTAGQSSARLSPSAAGTRTAL